jgi:hypothetical protein
VLAGFQVRWAHFLVPPIRVSFNDVNDSSHWSGRYRWPDQLRPEGSPKQPPAEAATIEREPPSGAAGWILCCHRQAAQNWPL